MSLIFEERPSDSPLVERVWRSQQRVCWPVHLDGAEPHAMVVWDENGKTYFTCEARRQKRPSRTARCMWSSLVSCSNAARLCPICRLGNLIDGIGDSARSDERVLLAAWLRLAIPHL